MYLVGRLVIHDKRKCPRQRKKYEPIQEVLELIPSASSKDFCEPAHPHNLVRTIAAHMHKVCMWMVALEPKFLIEMSTKHVLLVLKRILIRGSFEYPKHMLKLIGKKMMTILYSNIFPNLINE